MLRINLIVLFFLEILTGCSYEKYFNHQKRSVAGGFDSYEVENNFNLPSTVKRLIEFEQKFIDRSVDSDKILPPDILEQDLVFRPENQKWFRLNTYWIPEDELQVANHSLATEISHELIKEVEGKKFYRLIVHPESESFYEKMTSKFSQGEDVFATSTSSSRTVLIRTENGKMFFGKLSLNVKLGGVVRTVPRGEVARSVGTSFILDQLQKEKIQENHSVVGSFKYIRESLGIIPKSFERGGMIIREIPEIPKNHTLMPLFSLYAKNDNKNSLLEEWITHAMSKGELPADWIKKNILLPFAKGWLDAYLNQKIVMEAHAQNVLMELDEFDLPVGIYHHRDFGGFNVDLNSYREKSWFKNIPFFTSLEKDYHQEFRSKAIVQSLNTYFEGGFLFNLNRNYASITGDNTIDFRYEFRRILADEIKNKKNVSLDFSSGESFYKAIAKFEAKPSSCDEIMNWIFKTFLVKTQSSGDFSGRLSYSGPQ